MDKTTSKNPDFEQRIFTIEHWRDRYVELSGQLPEGRKALIEYLIEVDAVKFDKKKWVDNAANVRKGRAGLEVTREVCLALEVYLRKRVDAVTVESVFSRQKISF